MRLHNWTLLVLTASIGAVSTQANAQSPDLKPRVGMDAPPVDPLSLPERQRPFGVLPDSLAPDSTQFWVESYRSALEAAQVDPGILVFPDPTLDAKIRAIEPPQSLDPEMIFPRRDSLEMQGERE